MAQMDKPADLSGEILDLLNEMGEVIGQVSRSDVHGNPLLRHRAVHILVRNHEGEIFLQKRAPGKLIQPGKWDSSCGGHIPAGESWENGALRELEEELGLKLPDSTFLIFSHEYWWVTGIESELVRTYLTISEGPFTLESQEISDGRFWTTSELQSSAGKDILTPNLEEELRRIGILKQKGPQPING